VVLRGRSEIENLSDSCLTVNVARLSPKQPTFARLLAFTSERTKRHRTALKSRISRQAEQ
jgi:hypothetical protein